MWGVTLYISLVAFLEIQTMGDVTSGKSERISLRLDPATKRKIERAAALMQRSVTSFIVSSALGSADEVIHHSETMQLADEDRDQFFDAILNPPAPNDDLREAFETHERLTGKSMRND